MEVWVQMVLTSVGSVIASSGFWAYVQHKDVRRDATTKLLMGLAYEQLMTRGMKYIERGSVTRDEYEEYLKYFYGPYKDLGGNGLAERIASDVSKLPFAPSNRTIEIFANDGNQGYINNVRVVPPPEQNTTSLR